MNFCKDFKSGRCRFSHNEEIEIGEFISASVMSTKSARRPKTVVFLEHVTRDADRNHSCIRDRDGGDMRGMRKFKVVDRERPAYYWPRQVHRQKSKQGYVYVDKFYKINSVDGVIKLDEDNMLTSPTPSSTYPKTPLLTHSKTHRSASCEPPQPSTNACPHPLNKTGGSPQRKHSQRKLGNSGAWAYLVPCNRVFVKTLCGTSVIARNDEDGMYYPGKVTQCPNVRHCTVEFADGPQKVLTQFVIPVGGAVPRPPLAVGDYALVQVTNPEPALKFFVPGIVQVSPQNRQSQTQFYTLTLYNGQKVTSLRNHLVKISKERYVFSTHYINDMQGGYRNRAISLQTNKETEPPLVDQIGEEEEPVIRQASPPPAPVRRVSTKQQDLQEPMKKSAPTVDHATPLVAPRLMRFRHTLSALQAAEEVLARFSDDGWYYRGTVQQHLGDYSYIVKDATGYIERIWREDIVSNYDDNAPPLKEGDRVVAQHPCHTGSYAPGCIASIDEVLQTVEIQFYDGHQGAVARAEVYRLALEKYKHDVLHIQHQQRAMLGLSVVARDDRNGEYYPGEVVEVEEGGKYYVVRWSDGSRVRQLPVHVFSAMTRRPRLLVGDRVLAMACPELVVFLPGQIVDMYDDSMVVRFCDGQVRDDVEPEFCYWLSNGYHKEASYFWKISQPKFGLEP